MTFDMSQFHQVFFEETAEHLGNMEALLLELNVAQADPEQLNAIFRAAHSIKGSAGTFGFHDLADVTHILENLLDRIRKNELSLRVDMIDAFLDAGDVLKALLAAHRGESPADPNAATEICRRLQSLSADQAQPDATPLPQNTPAHPTASFEEQNSTGSYEIRFSLEASPNNPPELSNNLLDELAQFGQVTLLTQASASDHIDNTWHVRLDPSPQHPALNDTRLATLRETLEFIARSDSIRITPWGANTASTATEEAYGFFDEPAPINAGNSSTDEAYGFFEPLNAPEAQTTLAATSASTEEAYGFFAPLTAEETSHAAPTPTASTQTSAEDAAYGFFTDLPTPPVEEKSHHIAEPPTAIATPPAPAPTTLTALTTLTTPTPKVEHSTHNAPSKTGDTTIRVNIEKVDQLINLLGELVITQAMLTQSMADADPVQFERILTGLSQLERNTRDLQETVMSIRMMPISTVFNRFPRVVRDLSQKLGKQVELKTIGENTELDKGLIERIADPLTHLIRNSLDHGIESPAQRAAVGKPAQGTITLKAYHQSGHIVIEVGDDGGGLDRQRILAKAKERDLPVADTMTDSEVWLLIFEAGFSTAETITEVSGRGVGMDVVKRNITALGGRVEIDSMQGIGTRITVRLPLTLAILDGMSVAIGQETYIIPIGYVVESLQANKSMLKSISGMERLIQVRGEYLPLVALHEIFKITSAINTLEQGIMIILDADGNKFALFVDALIGQHQVVIKSLETNYRKVAGVSGATIMGDGRVAMILDITALAAMAKTAGLAPA